MKKWIDDRFKIYQVLGGEGKSGMGIVYVCFDPEQKSVLALKTFQDKYLLSKEIKERFKKEALSWIKLGTHPFIVRALSVEELDSRLFIILEYVATDSMGRNTLSLLA